MAVSNAFGSNVFNVFMGLGLPWFLYCFFAPEGYEVNVGSHTYHGLEAEGVFVPTVLLLVVLLLFLLLMASSGMRLYTWHAYLFFTCYAAFLVWAFGWELATPSSWPQTI
jgi:Ca2+/Na+ antiporter